MLVHPTLKGFDLSKLTNPGSDHSLSEDLKEAASSPSRSLEYYWDKPTFEKQYVFRKKAFVNYYEPLDWYICASVYYDNFSYKLTSMRKTLFIILTVFLIVSSFLSLWVSKVIAKPLKVLICHIRNSGSSGIPSSEIPAVGPEEICELSLTMNGMIHSIMESREKLKAEHDFSIGIIHGAPDLICGLDRDGNTIFINPAVEDLTGYSEEELIGKNWWDTLYAKENRKSLNESLQEIASQEVRDYEMVLTTKNSESKILIWNSLKKDKVDKDNVETIWFAKDITARKNTEKALTESENRFRAAFDSTQDCFLIWDKQYKCLYENKAAKNFTEKPLATLVDPSSHIEKDYLSGLGEVWRKRIDQVFSTGKQLRVQDELVLEEKRHYSDSILSPIIGAAGQVISVCLLYRDITEFMEAKDALAESEARYRTLFKAAGDAIWLMKEEKILDCNHKAQTMFGYSKEELLGKTPIELSPEFQSSGKTSEAEVYMRIDRVLQEGMQFFEWEHIRSDGQLIDVEVNP